MTIYEYIEIIKSKRNITITQIYRRCITFATMRHLITGKYHITGLGGMSMDQYKITHFS